MPTPVVQFVDKIGGTTRLNLMNLAGLVVGPDGIDLSPPRMRYAMSDSMLTDGSRPGSITYENRVLRFPLRWVGTQDPDAAGVAIGQISRELDRPSNVMKVQLGSTPVWFRTIRNSYTLQMLRLAFGQRKQTTMMLEIPAEPFGLGAMVALGPYTINNDPANATNPQRIILPTITGDVETPAFIYTATGLTNASETVTSMLAVSRGPTSGSPIGYTFVQAEALSLGTDTTLPGADAAMSPGTGSSYARTSFATDASMATRLSGGLGVFLRPGRYTVLARVRRSVSGDVVTMRYGQTADSTIGSYVYTPAVTLPAGTGAALVRLGVVQVPFGSALREVGYSGRIMSGGELMRVQAQRVSGTGNLDVDYLLYVPADYATLGSKLPASTVAPGTVLWDGPSEAVRFHTGTDPFTANETAAQVGVDGGFPALSPSDENVLHFLRAIDRGTNTTPTDTITAATVINVAYWPRYLVTP